MPEGKSAAGALIVATPLVVVASIFSDEMDYDFTKELHKQLQYKTYRNLYKHT